MSWMSYGPPVCPWRVAGRAVRWCTEAPVVTVEADAARVERRLGEGLIGCPGCGGRLSGWVRARPRVVRGLVEVQRLVPRRARCRSCGVTHVLLPVFVLLRRADTVEVIGAAVAARAAGAGVRRIAAGLGRPVETVRGWLRRLAGRLEPVRGWFTAVAVGVVGVDLVLPGPAGSAWADLVAAVAVAASAVAARFEPVMAASMDRDRGGAGWGVAGRCGDVLGAVAGPVVARRRHRVGGVLTELREHRDGVQGRNTS
jgi:hypothetical protein